MIPSSLSRIILGLLVWGACVTQVCAGDLEELVERYREWRGGGAFARMHAVRMEGATVTSGLTGRQILLATSDGDLRRDTDLGVVRSADARHGGGGWSLTQSGQLEALAPHVAGDLHRDALLLFDDFLDDASRLHLREGVERDGRTFAVLGVDFDDADIHELWLDEATGALYGLRIVRDRQEGFTRYDGWRLVEGVRMPFAQSTVTEGESPVTIIWQDIDIDPVADTDAFDPPAIPPNHVFADGRASTDFLPFELRSGSQIFIASTIEGAPISVLLDSGAEMTVLDLAVARRLGLVLEGEVVVQGTGGLSTGAFAAGVDIEVGGLTFHDLTVLVLDLGPVGLQIPAILGKDAFNALIVDLDFPNRRVAFHEPSAFTPPDTATGVELLSTGDIRAIRVSVEGRPPELFDFDTGNGSPLIIYPDYAVTEHLLDSRLSTTTRSGGVGGIRETRLASIDRIDIAGFQIRNIPTTFPPAGASAVDSNRTVGNVGLGILGRFRLMTDFSGGRLWMVADPEQLARPFVRYRTGLFLRKTPGALLVDVVAPGSPTDLGGWSTGDRILSVDGVAADDLTPEAILAILTAPADTVIVFKMVDGAERRLITRDYY